VPLGTTTAVLVDSGLGLGLEQVDVRMRYA